MDKDRQFALRAVADVHRAADDHRGDRHRPQHTGEQIAHALGDHFTVRRRRRILRAQLFQRLLAEQGFEAGDQRQGHRSEWEQAEGPALGRGLLFRVPDYLNTLAVKVSPGIHDNRIDEYRNPPARFTCRGILYLAIIKFSA